MKKTLIAMAVLAASGASFAQVTITGNYTIGYKASKTSPSTVATGSTLAQQVTQALAGGNAGNATGEASGLGVDTSLVTFTAKEDLGGGMSVAAEMSLDGFTRGTATGGDSSLKLTTGVGRITLQTYKPADYLSGSFGVGGVGMDNKVFPARTLKDAVGFDTKLGPVIVSISHQEQGTANSVFPNASVGLGQGAAGAASQVGQRLTSLSGTYISGGLVANLNYLTYDNRTDNSNTSNRDVVRAGVKYDFGKFQVGGGVSTLTTMSGGKLNSAAISAAVPMGALTLGANFATETADGFAAQPASATAVVPKGGLDQTRNGYGLSAKYDLSKRTALIATYADWLPYAGAERNTETNLLLSHSF
jgi:predicted porin